MLLTTYSTIQLAGGGRCLETQLRTGVKDLSKSLASTQRLLANDLQANDSHTFYYAENATVRTLIVPDAIISLLPPKPQSELEERETML